VIIHAGETIIVLEFKSSPQFDAAQVDQAAAYARDLREYHEASHWRRVEPVVVSTTYTGPIRAVEDVALCGKK
jgi:hypothetical protein